MDTLQSNIDYLTNKIEIQNIDRINTESQLQYEQDIITNQGICVLPH